MRSFDLSRFAAHLGSLAAGVAKLERALLDSAAQVIKAEAKRTIGHYQDPAGPFAPGAQSAQQMVGHGAREGCVQSDNMSLGKGSLSQSIEHTVRAPDAYVGSNLLEAEYQEFGNRTVPPHPALSGSAFRKAAEVRNLIGDRFYIYLAHHTE